MPEFKFELVSIPRFCKDLNFTTIFDYNGCYLHGPSIRPQLLGSLKHGLYYLESSLVPSSSSTSSFNALLMLYISENKAKLWRLRLGQLPVSQLHHVVPMFDNKTTLECVCQICLAAKQTRASFPTSSIKTSNAFHMFHLDVWGAFKLTTHNGCNFLTIVDDYTRMTWIFLLHNKSDVIDVIPQFVQYIETHFNGTM